MTQPKSAPSLKRSITDEVLDQVRLNLDWQAMFVGLGLRKCEKRSKPNDWWAYSPFHDEKTPSFHMGPGGIWYDFSAHEGGGAIELIQKLEGCNCYEAGERILESGWNGSAVALAINSTAVEAGSSKQSVIARQSTSQAVETAVKRPKPKNEAIRQDLMPLCQYHEAIAARGVSEETATMLGIGYLPQGRSQLKGRIVFQIADARSGPDDALDRVILSHIGRAVADAEPKYLFYEGFHKSAELYAQELIWLHDEAAEQAQACGHILLTEGPFDVAVAVEAGLRNVVASFGSSVSKAQAGKLKAMGDHLGVEAVLIAFDRDAAGKAGATKAKKAIGQVGLKAKIFDWTAAIATSSGHAVYLPPSIQDVADFKPEQIDWLRRNGKL